MADNIHAGHRARLRERAINEGLEGFHPHQVMELILFYAIPRQDTSVPAHLLIERFGTVRAVLTASVEELTKVQGIGKRAAQWLRSVGCLMESYIALRPEDRPRIVNYQMAFEYCQLWGTLYRDPQTFLLCMSPDGAIQSFCHLCDGTQWYDPEVLRQGLDDIMSVHSGNVILIEFWDGLPEIEPSLCAQAEAFAYTLRAMGVELLDVILVGEGNLLSLNRSGCFNREALGGALSALSQFYLREDVVRLDYEANEGC